MTDDQIHEIVSRMYVPIDGHPSQYPHWCYEFARAAIAKFLESTGQYVTNDASREAACTDAYSEGRKDEREEWTPVLEAFREVLRISDRKHDAWDAARAAIARANGEH